MRIAVFQSDLNCGGIQKALLNLLNHLDPEKYDIDLFLYRRGNFFGYRFGENVHPVFLNRAFPLLKYLPFPLAFSLYKPPVDLNREYDAAVDFNGFWHECAIGALKVRAKKRILWLHSDVEGKLRCEPRYRAAWVLGRAKYRRFSELAAVSQGVKDSFLRRAGRAGWKITVVQNTIDTDEIQWKAQQPCGLRVDPARYNFVSVGRLSREKGYDILLKEFARAAARRNSLSLYLIGGGPEEAALKRQAESLGLKGRIVFLGSRPNPFPFEKQMDGFVLASRYEGQGLVLREAQALGLAIVIPKSLESCNPDLAGAENLADAMCAAVKKEKVPRDFTEYNAEILRRIDLLFSAD
jgi:glycosyltransferase involved in cell wall biosynthesis